MSPISSLEGLTLKLKLQHFGHQMQRANSLEKTPMLGKTEGRRRRRPQRMRWLDGITNLTDMSLSELRERVKDSRAPRGWLSCWVRGRLGMDNGQERRAVQPCPRRGDGKPPPTQPALRLPRPSHQIPESKLLPMRGTLGTPGRLRPPVAEVKTKALEGRGKAY